MIYDLSRPFETDMSFPKSVGPFEEKKYFTHAEKGIQVTVFTSSTHTGTHIDFPIHFIDHAKTMDDYSVEYFIGRCVVVYVPKDSYEVITVDDVLKNNFEIKEGDIVFFNQGRGKYWKTLEYFEFASISEELANWLVEKKVKIVGMDCSSVDIANSQRTKDYKGIIHDILLSNEILIIEDLNFTEIPADIYKTYCLPLKLAKGDGGPIRVICETIDE